jgi:hypothetical protein
MKGRATSGSAAFMASETMVSGVVVAGDADSQRGPIVVILTARLSRT